MNNLGETLARYTRNNPNIAIKGVIQDIIASVVGIKLETTSLLPQRKTIYLKTTPRKRREIQLRSGNILKALEEKGFFFDRIV